MNQLDNDLARLFARDVPEDGSEAFVAAVRNRITIERRKVHVVEIGVGVLAALTAVALIAFAPDTVLYPVQFVQRYVTSPIGAAAGALAAAGLAWWTRFGEI